MTDGNTIGVCAELGNNVGVIRTATLIHVSSDLFICHFSILQQKYTGEYEDIKALNELIDKKCQLYGWDIGIHVDAGRFVSSHLL